MPEHIFQLLLINYDTIYRVFHTIYRFYYSDEILFLFCLFTMTSAGVLCHQVQVHNGLVSLMSYAHTLTVREEINQFYVVNILSKICGYNRPTLSESCGYNRAKQNIKILKFIAKQLVDKTSGSEQPFSRYKQLVVFFFFASSKALIHRLCICVVLRDK